MAILVMLSRRALIILATLAVAFETLAQLPVGGVVFDDFEYSSASWCSEVNQTCIPPAGTAEGFPLPGSVFGRNTWNTNTNGATVQMRAWYRYQWQEEEGEYASTSLIPTSGNSGHMGFKVAAGTYAGHKNDGTNPRQLMSGLAQRRGTWAARVNFGQLAPANIADIIQAFWLMSPQSGWALNQTRRWNEVDFEWNNRFAGLSQPHSYLSVAHNIGDVFDVVTRENAAMRLVAPPWPDGIGQSAPDPFDYDWSCKFVWGNFETVATLTGSQCTDIVEQQMVLGYTPLYDPGMVLFLRITDAGVFYSIASDGWGGVIVAETNVSSRTPNLPLTTVVSQHIQDSSTFSFDQDYSVDWVYYSPNTSIDINNVNQHVEYLRNTVDTPRFNSTGLSLERPFKHLPGVASTYGLQDRTSSLTLDLSLFPQSMAPGQTKILRAQPPKRMGLFRYSWRYDRQHWKGFWYGWSPLASKNGGWDADFTFPSDPNVVSVKIEIVLEELYSAENPTPINNPPYIVPITAYRSISRSGGGGAKQGNDPVSSGVFVDSLYAPFPSPAVSYAEIPFSLGADSHVQLRVLDALGRHVADLVNEYRSRGDHVVAWRPNNLARGVYYVHFEAGQYRGQASVVLTE